MNIIFIYVYINRPHATSVDFSWSLGVDDAPIGSSSISLYIGPLRCVCVTTFAFSETLGVDAAAPIGSSAKSSGQVL